MKKHTSQTSIADTLIFGGPHGKFSPIQDSGDQIIIFKGGRWVDSIQIGNTLYGGDGGVEQGRAKLPPLGTFLLKELQCLPFGDIPIAYMKVEIEDEIIEVGSKEDAKMNTILLVDLRVRFAGISCDSHINKLQFDIIR